MLTVCILLTGLATPRAEAQPSSTPPPSEVQALDVLRQLQAAPAVPGGIQQPHPAGEGHPPQTATVGSGHVPHSAPIAGSMPASGHVSDQPSDVAPPPLRRRVVLPKVRGAFDDPSFAEPQASASAALSSGIDAPTQPQAATSAPSAADTSIGTPAAGTSNPSSAQPTDIPATTAAASDFSQGERAVPAPVVFARYNGLLERSPFEMRKREAELPPPEAGFGESYTLVSLVRMAERDTAILREKGGLQRTIVVTSTEPELMTGQHLLIAEVLSDASSTQRGVVLQSGEERATLRLETAGVPGGAPRVQTFQSPDAAESRARIRREIEERFVPFHPQVLLLSPPALWPLDPDVNLRLADAFKGRGAASQFHTVL